MIRFGRKKGTPFFGYYFVTFHNRTNFRVKHPLLKFQDRYYYYYFFQNKPIKLIDLDTLNGHRIEDYWMWLSKIRKVKIT